MGKETSTCSAGAAGALKYRGEEEKEGKSSVIFQGMLAFDENVMCIQEETEEVIKYGYLKIITIG